MIGVPEVLLTLASPVSCGKNEVMKDHSLIDMPEKGHETVSVEVRESAV